MATTGEQIIALTESTDTIKKCVLANDIGCGNCVQMAGSYVALTYNPDFEPGQGQAVWSATIYSSDTQWGWGDTWHNTFTFLTADGGAAASIRWDGPEMHDDNRQFPVKKSGVIAINPDLWGQITQVRWSYEC